MNSVVCTLFEGHYHLGLAALTNSLHRNGFRGDIYAGYRGILPPWAKRAKSSKVLDWEQAETLVISDDLRLHFLPLDTGMHLTNYKPHLMLKLLNGLDHVDAVAYFDPDIVVKCRWSFYDEWMSHGVALVHEVVSNDMPATHPLRLGWHAVILACNKTITRSLTSYLNAGFCGVSKANTSFLTTWIDILTCGINIFGLNPEKLSMNDRTHLFHVGDQDALNIAAMCAEVQISEMGPEGMDFAGGGWTMAHAAGAIKPWKKNYLLSAVRGEVPTSCDKNYWQNALAPIPAYPETTVKLQQTCIRMASFFGRFYRRY